jgi:hypothetical protein
MYHTESRWRRKTGLHECLRPTTRELENSIKIRCQMHWNLPSAYNKYDWGPSRRGGKGCSCGSRDKSQPLFVLWREREKVQTVSVFGALIQASSNLSHQTKNKVRVFAAQKHYLQLHDLNSTKFRIRSSRLAGLLLPWLNSWSGSGTP